MAVHRLPGPCYVIAWPDGTRPPRFSVHIETLTIAEDALATVTASGAIEGRHQDCGGWAWHTPAEEYGACTDCGCEVEPGEITASVPGIAQLTWFCRVAACDCGRCPADLLMGDDDSVVHAATPDDLAIQARWHKWRITTSNHAYCPDGIIPDGAVLLTPRLWSDNLNAVQLTIPEAFL